MKRYDIEIIHEPSGAYLNYSFESDIEESDMDILGEFIRDISVVITDVEDLGDEE